MTSAFSHGVFVGRFQPPHTTHLAVMLEALARVDVLVIVLGSTRSARTPKNPFTDEERREMIAVALDYAGVPRERFVFGGVRDLYDMRLWARAVREEVARRALGATRVALIGHEKDASSTYLREFPDWPYLPTRVKSDLSATRVRRALFDLDFGTIERLVPPPVATFLKVFSEQSAFAELRDDDAFVRRWHAAFVNAPVPPTFLSVHALVRRGDRVWLKRRDERPNSGLWTLPGGRLFERLGAEASLRRYLNVDVDVSLCRIFDHPDRSLLGREVMLAYEVDAEPTNGGEWWNLSDALAAPESFYADHHRALEVLTNTSRGT
ncbi:adenylyltransferase/cytidyltransferase family protein [Deinococcus yavapaiensis]|uniref:Bifunctional NMN adenylyltransferase/nudix hydrolase n=1 Tax=Deinococcus yavapaiensis KR-236 TaxID=694435 RepID=A0A318S4R5_9DEIO|nr:adenylyltransferase/cytidyltransferase family protein [Deinococcus yavapaiensis]PYE53416.1 bifunctional NMN adenylyltransferase/nudix hydrolase [Deinococcus yavapaiensis KR-236]